MQPMAFEGLMDLYVLASERTEALSRVFIERWAKGFEPAADEYEFPQYADHPHTEIKFELPQDTL